MPNIKNKTLELCQHLDLLKIPIKDTQNKVLEKLYIKIIDIYKSLKNIKVDHISSKKINSESNMCIIIQILKYMFQQKMIHNIDIGKSNCDILQKLILQENHNDLGKFLNIHSRPIYKVIGDLIWNHKLPQHILGQLDKYDNLLYGHFTPLAVHKEIESSNLIQNKYKIVYQRNTINLSIFTINGRKINKKRFDIIVRRIVLISVLSSLNTINIDLYFTKQEKKIGKNISLLGPHEINSGVTSWGNINKISIFREEEMNKLIIHELIHYCNLDFHSVDFPYIDNYNINPNTKIILNESYTEIMANIINCICCSYEYQDTENMRLFKLYLNYETKYSIYQCAKILILFGFKNYSDFNKTYDGKHRFKQTTSVFSYFFAKSALLHNIDYFGNFLETYVMTNKKQLHIQDISNAKSNYASLVHDSLQNDHFAKLINSSIDKILRMKNISTKIKNTLRMTCIES